MALQLEKLDENKGAPRYPFLTDGDYVLEFLSAQTGTNFKDKKEYFKVTARVVESTGGADVIAPGTTITLKIDEEPTYGFHVKDIRNLVASIMDETEDRVTSKIVNEILAEDNPAKGEKFKARRGMYEAKGRIFRATRYAGMTGTLPPLANPAAVESAPVAKGKAARK